ncbi:TetR/AcrR family transcriptional regulator [Kribbella sancticallisti]|uniref:TetR/AcrR family transcriptional regulator n=1 Tax=Kribbella sancticallisti TaxID=460087 RepID=A0ABN2EVX2_9ACTN
MGEREEIRGRIVDAATTLLRDGGRESVTTRAVSTAAGVQAPTLYRLFTDMSGLLEAVAADGFARYLAQKHSQALTADPVQDLRRGWDTHVGFGLENPAHYLLMYGHPAPGSPSRAATQSLDRLRLLVERIAVDGRLVVSVETAVAMVHSAGVGLTLNLIGIPPEDRDPALSGRLREAVIAAITAASPTSPPNLSARAVGLKAVLDQVGGLYSAGERALLDELLDRAAGAPPGS